MRRYKITKRFVDGLPTPRRDRSYSDSELRGFSLRVKASGIKSYCIRYRDASGRLHRETLGRHGELTPDHARGLALERLGAARHRSRTRGRARYLDENLTVRQLAATYVEEYGPQHKKPDTRSGDERLLRLHILPGLGDQRVTALTRREVAKWHRASSKRAPVQANRALSLLKAILNWGDREELVAEGSASCCCHIKRNPETPRSRFLSREELRRLGKAIDEAEREGTAHPSALLALRLLILTGCRRSEILKLKWREVDFERSCLRLEDSKTGPRVVPLGTAALALLHEAPRTHGNPFVCAGTAATGRYSNIQAPWRRIRKAAGLEDVRIHDLRHSFASAAAGQGVSLPIIGHLLGHRRPETTARYAHLARPVVQTAADSVADQLSQDLGS